MVPQSAELRIKVEAVRSNAARHWEQRSLQLPTGARVTDALTALGWLPSVLAAEPPLELAVWGRRAALEQPLSDGDRIELCRAIQVDPKVARRERFEKQGKRSAGLFSRRRPGAKPGY